jgi:D-alanyl-D-alanine dipeptidase
MMKYWRILIILFQLNVLYAQDKNEFGLVILKTNNAYLNALQNDSNQLLIDLRKFIPHVRFDWRYATTNNFTKIKLYKHPKPYLRKEAAIALKNAALEFEKMGLGIKIYDAYRPYTVTKKMWEVVPDDRYAANPAKGSGHNRGAAVDLTLYNLKTKEDLAMPTPYDDFTEKAHHYYNNLDSLVIANRELLKTVLAKYGLLPLSTEWWHYYLPNAANRFDIMDIDFKQLKKVVPKNLKN